MDSEPTNEEVSVQVGIDEVQVERYRKEALRLGDGSWLVHFDYNMPKELRQRFTGSFTVVIRSEASKAAELRQG